MALLARSSAMVARPTSRVAVPRPAVAPVPARRVAVRAASDDVNKKLQESLNSTTEYLSKTWEKTEDKPAAVAVTLSGLLVLITASSVVDTIDKIPIIGDLIELIGIGVTGWFVWRYLLFGPDRQELVSNIKAFVKKVYGA
jgi:hypothetical protein